MPERHRHCQQPHDRDHNLSSAGHDARSLHSNALLPLGNDCHCMSGEKALIINYFIIWQNFLHWP